MNDPGLHEPIEQEAETVQQTFRTKEEEEQEEEEEFEQTYMVSR